ncbi:hypothetical protein Ciccas_005801, partial [Cichlidogyrus casuarinus]
ISKILDELRYDNYYETQEEKGTVEFDRFLRLLINHRSSNENDAQIKIENSFGKIAELLKDETDEENGDEPQTVDTAKLVNLLLTQGEAMSEAELADDLATLLEVQGKDLADFDLPDKLTLNDLYAKLLQIAVKPEEQRVGKTTKADRETNTVDA